MTWTTRPRSDFGTLRAIRTGEGAPILLLHGVGLRAEAWNGQIVALSNHFAVIAPDMPGHGETQLRNTSAELSAYTDRVAEALSEPVLVAGHSMGALMALDLAIRYPDQVMGVAALNAIYRRTIKADKAVKARALSLPDNRPTDPTPTLSRWFQNLERREATACRTWLAEVDPASYKQAYTVFAAERGPSDQGLSALHMPAFFMTGAEEPNSTPAMSEAMAALTPQGQVRIIEGAAHMMPMTHAEIVNEELLTFFTECLS